MSLKADIRRHIIDKYDEVKSVLIRGDGVIHAKDKDGKPIYSFRLRDFDNVSAHGIFAI